jgi:hypothetical protein
MTLRLQGEILMDADQAKAELQATGTAAKGAAQDMRGMGAQGTNAARGVGQLGAAARASATGLAAAGRAAEVNAAAARKVSSANRLAAGSMGNLVAQGNDVITMLVAGQNPMQLAFQQGTQITQVIGPLGAAGAFRALGGAVLSMLSPINLITIGALAATAAVVNWFTASSDEAESFEKRIEALGSRIDSLREKIADASATRFELAERFGQGFVDRAETLLDRIVEAEKRLARRTTGNAIEGFLGETGVDFARINRNRAASPQAVDAGIDVAEGNARFALARELGLTEGLFGRLRGESRALVNDVLGDMAALQAAATGTVEEQAAALDALIESYRAAANAVDGLTEAEDARLLTLEQMRLELQAVLREQDRDPAQIRAANEMAESLDLLVKAANEQIRANQAAQDMLATMTEQNALAEAIARFGSDSAAVTRLRAEFARDAKLEEIAALPVSEAIKQELRDAAQHAFEIATSDMSGTIRAAGDEAARLAAEMRGAVGALEQLKDTDAFNLARARIAAEFRDDPVKRAGALAGLRFDRLAAPIINASDGDVATLEALERDRAAAIARAEEIARETERGRPPSRRRSGSAEERERVALERLIEAKRRELDVLRETDPVQREMLRLRERLTAATPKQREEIEALIEAHFAEIAAMERKEEFRDILGDVLLQAESLEDVWKGIGDAVIRAAQQALIFGQGPLAGLLGGGGGGGLAGGLVGGVSDLFGLFSGGSLINFAAGGLPADLIPRFAEGSAPRTPRPGLVLGEGTGRSDSILARISAGEFIVNAQATARNRPLLDAINSGGRLPGFAGGGLPLSLPGPASGGGGAQAGGALSSSPGVTRILIEPSELFRVVAEERARGVAVEVVDDFSAQQLPARVEAIRRDPLGRG